MRKIERVEAAISPDCISEIKRKLGTAFRDLKADYFPDLDEGEFLSKLQKESVVSRIFAYRFCDMENIGRLVQQTKEAVRMWDRRYRGAVDRMFFLGPLIYVRFCYPGVFLSKKHERAFLYTEPHYDSYYGGEGVTVWVPLEDTNPETGGLCYFDFDDNEVYFPKDGRNRYSIGRYLDDCQNIDPLLRQNIVDMPCATGSFLFFDKNILHGATKPVTRMRYSINFHLVERGTLPVNDDRTRTLFEAVNGNLDACNAINLYFLGDVKGYRRKMDKLNRPTGDLCVDEMLDRIESRTENVPRLGEGKMHWSEEYSWIQ